jgi:hypothetical protein
LHLVKLLLQEFQVWFFFDLFLLKVGLHTHQLLVQDDLQIFDLNPIKVVNKAWEPCFPLFDIRIQPQLEKLALCLTPRGKAAIAPALGGRLRKKQDVVCQVMTPLSRQAIDEVFKAEDVAFLKRVVGYMVDALFAVNNLFVKDELDFAFHDEVDGCL